jgi:hypothetical protein
MIPLLSQQCYSKRAYLLPVALEDEEREEKGRVGLGRCHAPTSHALRSTGSSYASLPIRPDNEFGSCELLLVGLKSLL